MTSKTDIRINISVVIPTFNRKDRLLNLLNCLDASSYRVKEVIVVDGGDDRPAINDLSTFKNLKISYVTSTNSVCMQRNIGINRANGEWVFLCDDDIEVPENYLETLANYCLAHADVGVVSGLILQKEDNQWTAQYPITSSLALLWRYIFQLSIWGEIRCKNNNLIIDGIKQYYKRKGNHMSKAGWPVITDFSGEYFTTPIYGLGASLIKKKWLIESPFDERLDTYGAGDNYGVALGFPKQIHVITSAKIFHHRELKNRQSRSREYFNRIMALDYFVRKKLFYKKRWLVWSLVGNSIVFLVRVNWRMFMQSLKAIVNIILGRNPLLNSKNGR